METDKRRSKGGFLSLFDWNGKSRKKLFSDNPNKPEESKQGKENVEGTAKSQLNRMLGDGDVAGPSYTTNCDFSGALSINSDEGCGAKAPGLVARLMGLDILPASTVPELSSAALYGPDSLGSCHEDLLGMNGYQREDYIKMPCKPEKPSRDATESRVQKGANRPIKKFQTEILPPKSAKPIPVTHNKLLSPIKSQGLIPPRNAAHIMEAAAKIIEASPWPYMKNNKSPAGPSSLPLRILSLKEKMEAAQRASMPEKPVDSSTANPVKGKPSGRSNNSCKYAPAFKAPRDSEKNSSRHLGSKGKSLSPAIESKASVQKRDTLTPNGNRGYVKHKEQNEMKSNQFSRSQKPKVQQSMQLRTGTSWNRSVLGQNNQKQNSVANKGASASRTDSNNKPTTRARSSESTTEGRKTTNEGAVSANNGPGRSSRRGTDTQKDFSHSKAKKAPQKKRHISRGVFDEARDPNKAVNNCESKSIKCNITTDGIINQDALNMKESKDVVSFTFTSPLRKNMPESQSSIPLMGTKDNTDVTSLNHCDLLYPEKLSSAPSGLHAIDGDALSVLLEKKLRELASRINLPRHTQATEGSSGLPSGLQDKMLSVVSTKTREQDKSFHLDMPGDTFMDRHAFGCSSSDDLVHNKNQQLQTLEATEGPSYSSNYETGNDPGCQHPGPVGTFETRCASESYLGSEESAYGSTVYSSTQDEDVSNFCPVNESAPLENGANFYEQRSSLSVEDMTCRRLSSTSIFSDLKISGNTELEYVTNILSSAELMTEDFVLGQINEVIMPNLFDALERQMGTANDYQEEDYKLERKVWFDCVGECLELRCRQAFMGSWKGWPRWMELNQRKGRLAEEVYNEILGYKSMEEEMIDELVNKDMSSGYGKWLDFDMEASEKASEIEWEISTCLIEEIVSDLLLV